MSVKWEKTEINTGVLAIEVESEKVDRALDRAFKTVVQKINVPGFRKGKVPRKIFESRFGVASLYQDALDILLPEAYSAAVIETKIEPVDRPNIDIIQMEVGKPLIFNATVIVKPEVTLGVYEGVTYEDQTFEVTEEKEQEELERIRNGHAELHVIEDEAAVLKDVLVMDFKGYVDGEAFEGGEAENYQIELGSGTFVPGFEDQLIGVKAGEDKEIQITFPEDYHVKSLAGKPAKFDVHVHDVKRRVLPELDDDFVRDISEFDTLEEYKSHLREDLAHRAQHEHEHYVQDVVVSKVVEEATVEIPAVMIEQEIDQQVRDFETRMEQQGVPLDAYLEFTGTTKEELRGQFREDAGRRVKTSLVLEAIAKAQGLTVTQEDVDLEIQKVADSVRMDFENTKRLLQSRDPQFLSFAESIITTKAVDWLVAHSVQA